MWGDGSCVWIMQRATKTVKIFQDSLHFQNIQQAHFTFIFVFCCLDSAIYPCLASGGRGPPAFLQQHQSHPQQPPLQQQQQQQHYPPNSSSSSSSSSSMIPPPHPPPPAMKIEAVVASTDKQQLIAMFPQLKVHTANQSLLRIVIHNMFLFFIHSLSLHFTF